MPKLLFIFCLLLIAAVLVACVYRSRIAEKQRAMDPAPAGETRPFNHAELDGLLQTYVNDKGKVDYAGLLADESKLDAYLRSLAEVDLSGLPDGDERMAFWINAYNACTLKGVLRHLPEDRAAWKDFSVKKTPGFWTTDTYVIAGEPLTLDFIEHKILRVKYDEPRVHFALVCASETCPILETRAFTGDSLSARLQTAAERFVNDPAHVRFNPDAGTLYVSKIFDWYARDFGGDTAAVLEFIAKYTQDPALASRLRESDVSVEYNVYDWSLNDR